jgi:hypothetical protein
MKNHGVLAQPGATQRTTSMQQEAEGHTESDARLPQGQMPNVGSQDVEVNIPSWVGVFFVFVFFRCALLFNGQNCTKMTHHNVSTCSVARLPQEREWSNTWWLF